MRVKAWMGWGGTQGPEKGQKERKVNLRQVHGQECQKKGDTGQETDVATTSYITGRIWGEVPAWNLQVTSVLHWALLTPWDLLDP